MHDKNGRRGAALALVLIAFFALACSALKNLGGNELAEANKLVQEANDELKEVDRISDENDSKVNELYKADDAGNAADVKRLLGELMTAIDEGLKHGEVAADKLEKAAKLKVDSTYQEYLSLKSQMLRKQIEAFKERKEAARIMRDNYDSTDKEKLKKAKDDFRAKNNNYKRLLAEAKELGRKADDISRKNPDKIKPSS